MERERISEWSDEELHMETDLKEVGVSIVRIFRKETWSDGHITETSMLLTEEDWKLVGKRMRWLK